MLKVGCKKIERFALTGAQGSAGLDDRLRRLDTGALRGVEVLLVADDLAGAAIQVVKQEIARAAEARVEQYIEVVAGGGEDQFHCLPRSGIGALILAYANYKNKEILPDASF